MSAPFVIVGVPSADMWDADFGVCLNAACMYAAMHGVVNGLINSKGVYVDKGRQKCMEKARDLKARQKDGSEFSATHLLFLDSDMVFPPEVIMRLASHDKDIVGALYSRRTQPFTNLGCALDTTVSRATSADELIEMKWLATGCLLIKMSVFEEIERRLAPEDGPVWGYRWIPEVKEYEREDIRFCRLAREAGFSIWGDIPLSGHIGHIGQAVYRVQEDTKAEAMEVGVGQDRLNDALPEKQNGVNDARRVYS